MAKKTPRAAALLDAPGFGAKMAQASGKDGTVSLLAIDLDDLHQLNLTTGRDAGDRFIAAAAKTITAAGAREGWIVGRLGGDEFAALLPGVPLEQAFLRADSLRDEIGHALEKAVPERRCTASIGVANYPRDAKNADELKRKADLALYAAKEQGGGAVSLTPGENMVLRSSYYPAAQLGRLRSLAERQKKKEAVMLREALDDLIRKYDRAS
jgi:diguanylate cyclase (GGDEF)-like protein